MHKKVQTMVAAGMMSCTFAGSALAEYPAPVEGSYTIKDFRIENGEILPEMKVGYLTIGDPAGQIVSVIHGTTGSAKGMLAESFAEELFAPGKPLDATKYFIILPDTIGAGNGSKPSDGSESW